MRLACALLLVHAAARPQQRAKPLALKPVTGRAAAKPLINHEALQVSGGTIAKASDAEMRQAVITTIGVVLSACAFGVGVAVTRGKEVAMEFFAGYLVEQSLSVDNLLVFLVLFEYFKVPPGPMQDKALAYGLYGAVVCQAVFVGLGGPGVETHRRLALDGDRQDVRAGTVVAALDMLGEVLLSANTTGS